MKDRNNRNSIKYACIEEEVKKDMDVAICEAVTRDALERNVVRHAFGVATSLHSTFALLSFLH